MVCGSVSSGLAAVASLLHSWHFVNSAHLHCLRRTASKLSRWSASFEKTQHFDGDVHFMLERPSFVKHPQLLPLIPCTDVAARFWRVRRALCGTQLPGIVVKAQLPPSLTAGLTIEDRLAVADAASDERAIVEVSLHEDHLRLFQRRKARPDTNLQIFRGEHYASFLRSFTREK